MDLTAGPDCAGVREHLPLLPGGELPGAIRAAVLRHLRGCHGCQRLLSGYLASGAALRAAAGPGPDASFFAGLRASILAEVGRLPVPASRPRRWRAAVAAACLLLGAAGAWLARGSPETPGAGLLHQPPLAAGRPRTHASAPIVPVSFWPSAQGLRGLQQLGRDPRWTDGPREAR